MSGLATPAAAPVHPLLDQLVSRHGFTPLDADTIDAFVAAAGHTLLVFTEDPVRYKETLDLAVIAPEVARAFEGRFRVGVLLPAAARKVAPRYGFARWPALVMLKDGAYVGAIDGLRNWDEYLDETLQLLARNPSRPPSVGVAVRSAAAPTSGCGH
jgi:hydrogenase-1 operon protein HyaE